jgi:excisionase family DNA binding protein
MREGLRSPEVIAEVGEMADASSGVFPEQAESGLTVLVPVEQPPDQRARKPYKVKQIADALGVSPAAIYREIETGRLTAYRIGKGALRIPPEAFEHYKALITAAAATKRQAGVA